MNLLLFTSVFLLPPLVATQHSTLESAPRKHVLLHGVRARRFHEEGVLNYTNMLLMEDLGLLVLGARETVLALDLHDISKRRASVRWEVTESQRSLCRSIKAGAEALCMNYITVLHRVDAHKMHVCGTNAFSPKCINVAYSDGKLTLEPTVEDGKTKSPFDPAKRSASVMVDNDLYSATFKDFWGRDPSICRSEICNTIDVPLFNDPTFVSMSFVPESENSPTGDDDKIYLFFNEKAVECDCNSNLLVSRVARVCKGDQGGGMILRKKWTTFLKARIVCPVQESQWSHVIKDTYLWCDPQQQWQNCMFYAIFTPEWDTGGPSAVCGYRLSDISRVFSEGRYKTRDDTSISPIWRTYNGDVPSPRPGACINKEARDLGIHDTQNLLPTTLDFVKNKFLMDDTVKPIGGKPLLLRRGVTFNHIIVSQMTAADGQKYNVMFVSTEDGTVLKSVNYDGEMFTIEEMQLFQPGEPIKTLTFSRITNQLYAGSDSGVAQIPLASCDRSSSCLDCVLSRDPHCGWDKSAGKCVALSASNRELIQSVRDGNASLCPSAQDSIQLTEQSTWSGGNLKLSCPLTSNFAKVSWERDNRPLKLSDRLQQLEDGLLILNASGLDSGQYSCLLVERSKTEEYTSRVAKFNIQITKTDPNMMAAIYGLQVAVALLACLCIGLLSWTIYKQQLFFSCPSKKEDSRYSKVGQQKTVGRRQVSELH